MTNLYAINVYETDEDIKTIFLRTSVEKAEIIKQFIHAFNCAEPFNNLPEIEIIPANEPTIIFEI